MVPDLSQRKEIKHIKTTAYQQQGTWTQSRLCEGWLQHVSQGALHRVSDGI